VLETLHDTGLPPRSLTVELLESALDVVPGVTDRLARLRDAGVRLAVDDFGTGYSSLSRVAALPITELKLDRSLVAGVENERMVSAVARMGQTLGLRLVAEGIESEVELQMVRGHGYDAAQGYLLSRPVESSKVTTLLEAWRRSPDTGPPLLQAVPAGA
jgi:EAL domain-containing protein (putative c-di-GMP-specific phosphodiesterase class I)